MIRHLNQNEEIKNLGFRIMTDEEISGLDPCTFLNWLNVFESILIVSVFFDLSYGAVKFTTHFCVRNS